MSETKNRTCANGKNMPAEEQLDIRDNLRLALDEIETGPLDFIGLRNCVRYQRDALTMAHRRMEVMR